MAGEIDVAKQICRRKAYKVGLCVNIQPTDYIYTGGQETGYCIELLNYPRFPVGKKALEALALELALELRQETYQHSFLIENPLITRWYSVRKHNE